MNVDTLAADMIASASNSIGASWKSIQEVAVHEFRMLATRIVNIATALASGEMKKSTASILFRSAKSQIVAVLALVSTMMAVATQKAVNAALAVVKSAVNTVVGFSLIA